MKKTFTYITLITAVACNTADLDPQVQYGEITVSLGEPNLEVITKADDASNYTVRIFNDDATKMAEGIYSSIGAVKLPLNDTYYVTAENCTEVQAEAGDGVMRLYGRSGNVILDASHLSETAEVNCTVANAKVAVKFDSSVNGKFNNDLKVVLTGGTTAGRTLTINAAGGDKETWFNPSTVNYTISGTFNAGGVNKAMTLSGSLTLNAKDNKAIIVKVSLSNGQLTPQISIDGTLHALEEVVQTFNPYQ